MRAFYVFFLLCLTAYAEPVEAEVGALFNRRENRQDRRSDRQENRIERTLDRADNRVDRTLDRADNRIDVIDSRLSEEEVAFLFDKDTPSKKKRPRLHVCHPYHPKKMGLKSGCCAKYGPCPLYLGDCNKDSECMGFLKCNIHNKGNSFGYRNNGVDVCGLPKKRPLHKCHPKHPKKYGFKGGCCAKYGLCPLFVGDCTKSSQCAGGSECNELGFKFGYKKNPVKPVKVCGFSKRFKKRSVEDESELGSLNEFLGSNVQFLEIGVGQYNSYYQEEQTEDEVSVGSEDEVSVGFGFGLFQKNCPDYNKHECCGKRDNRHIQFGNSECVIARNGVFRSGHECEPLSWAQGQDAANIGSCRICSNNPNRRVGNSCMCNGNYCDANQFCYNGRCNSAAQIPNCMNDGNNPISTQCYCGGNNRCPAGKYCYDGHCRNSGRGPVCCRAYTASCLACAQGVSESWYCTNNCDVPGCDSYCYTEPVVVRSVRNNRAEAEVGDRETQLVGSGLIQMLVLALIFAVLGFYIGQRKLKKDVKYNLLTDVDEVAMVSYQTQKE